MYLQSSHGRFDRLLTRFFGLGSARLLCSDACRGFWFSEGRRDGLLTLNFLPTILNGRKDVPLLLYAVIIGTYLMVLVVGIL